MGLRSARGCRKLVECREDAENHRSVQSPLRSGPGIGTPCLLSHSIRKNKSQDRLGPKGWANATSRADGQKAVSHGAWLRRNCLRVRPATWRERSLPTNHGIGIPCGCNNPPPKKKKTIPATSFGIGNVAIKSRNNAGSSGCVCLPFQVKKPWEQLHPTLKD